MRKVIPLRYGTAFKKAFRKPHIYSAFVRDILDIEFEAKEVFEEYAFHPPVGRVNIRYDLFAEDPARRVVVEMQHIRDDETLDRFLYYHLIGQVEQVQGSDTYRFQRRVYTVVVLTRLPTKEELKFDVGVLSSKLSTLDGKELKDFGHRLVFVNARASKGGMPEGVRKWMELIEDSLDEEMDETRYGDPVMREVIEEIEREKASEDERFKLKEEAVWENAKREVGQAAEQARQAAEEKVKEEAQARQAAEEKAKEALEEARQAVVDVCELLSIELTKERSIHLAALDIPGLRELRAALKQQKRWPALPHARARGCGARVRYHQTRKESLPTAKISSTSTSTSTATSTATSTGRRTRTRARKRGRPAAASPLCPTGRGGPGG